MEIRGKKINSEKPDPIKRQLLQNQSFLCNENEKLQDDVTKLTRQLEELKNSSATPEFVENLKKEKDKLLGLNETLKKKLKSIRYSGSRKRSDVENETKEKKELFETVKELGQLLQNLKHTEQLEVKPEDDKTATLIASLTKKIEEQEKKSEESLEIIRKLRDDDEKYILREKITHMKQLLTDLEVENSKLKYENEQLTEDLENYKNQLNEALEDAKNAAKKCYALEDEKDQLKKIVSDLENEKIQIKKDMIEEMNEANRAKRVSGDTELALQHISEAYENKRKEVKQLMEQLDEAETIIKGFQEQFDPLYK